MMKKSTLLYALLFYFLFVGWGITPAQAHIEEPCPHKEGHQHCQGGSGGDGGGSIVIHGADAGNAGPIFIQIGSVNAYRIPRDGTIQNIRIFVLSNSYNGAAIVTLFVDGSPTSLSATIPTESTGAIDIAGTVDVFDGEGISVVMDTDAVNSGSISLSVSYEVL